MNKTDPETLLPADRALLQKVQEVINEKVPPMLLDPKTRNQKDSDIP